MELQQRITHLLQMLEKTKLTECDCAYVYEIMDEAAELVAAGADLTAVMPEVTHHFELCGCCRSEFAALQRILTEPALQ